MNIQNFKPANLQKYVRQISCCLLLILSFLKSNAADFYWVNGSGNWSDFANHWATTSGGTTFHTQPPSPADNVFLDSNSFISSFDTLYVDQGLTNIYCKDFKCDSLLINPTFYCHVNAVLNVFGSIILSNDINFSLLGKITFQGNAINEIFMDGIDLTNSGYPDKITFNGDGIWDLLSEA